MKTVLFTRYGPPEGLEIREVATPVPSADQVLVKVQAAALNIADWYTLHGGPSRLVQGISRPKDPRIGSDLAGVVEAVGSQVTRFKPGDQVFGAARGSFAEYVLARPDRLVMKPTNVSFAQAAAVPVAGTTALQGLRDAAEVQPGMKVLIEGASGGVGTFLVLLARAFQAEVTAVVSSRSLEVARSIGADHVIDYTQEDFTRSGRRYDRVMGVNGYRFITAYRPALTPQGAYVMVGANRSGVLFAVMQASLLGPVISKKNGQKFSYMGLAKINQADLQVLGDYLGAGKINPVIDRCFPFSQVVQALCYLGEGHARGKLVITMDETVQAGG